LDVGALVLERVRLEDRAALEALFDDYLRELASHRDVAVGATDARSHPYLPLYWAEPGRHPFFIVDEGRRSGFAMVREVPSEAVVQMAEFFLAPGVRRRGLGRQAVAEIWRRLPGDWQLQVHVRNEAGIAFWDRCVRASARGEVRVYEVIEDDGRRLQFDFEIPAR